MCILGKCLSIKQRNNLATLFCLDIFAVGWVEPNDISLSVFVLVSRWILASCILVILTVAACLKGIIVNL